MALEDTVEKPIVHHVSQQEPVLTTKARHQEASRTEHEIGLLEAAKRYPTIILITTLAQLGPFVYGFDAIAFSICLAMSPFQATFGISAGDGSYIIPAYWQTLWNSIAQIAIMLGAVCSGTLGDTVGRRPVLSFGAVISMAGIAVAYIAHSPGVFLAGKVINGFALGMLNAIGITYISEITPLRLRGVCLSALIFSMNVGCLVASSIAFSRVKVTTSAAYKVLFATEWVWPGIIILAVWFVPESPHYLVKRGQNKKALQALKRLRNNKDDTQLLLDDIVFVHESEKRVDVGTKNAFALSFKGTNWRRTRIIIYLNGMGQLIGASFVNNAPYFLIQAGLSSSLQGMIIEIGFALGCVTAIITWFFLDTIGRRPVLYAGMGIAAVVYLGMGIAGCFNSPGSKWAIGVLLMVVICTNGPVVGAATSIAGEISQAELRAISQTIGFAFNFFFTTVWQVVIPYMFNADEGNLGGKMGFIFFACCILGLALIHLEIPETKDRSFAELDEMFDLRLPTKSFKTYNIETQA